MTPPNSKNFCSSVTDVLLAPLLKSVRVTTRKSCGKLFLKSDYSGNIPVEL